MHLKEIYHHYHIPPGLQKHMLTTAAVGKYLVDHWQGFQIDQQKIIAALLVHDLGNLVKFDLNKGALVIEATLFTNQWRQRQQKMRDKYGSSSHQATLTMLSELGLPKEVQQLARKMDAGNVCQIVDESIEQQICEYADLRVVPSGIAPLSERLVDLRKRYGQYKSWHSEQGFQDNVSCAQQIEDNLQQQTSVDITTIPLEKIDAYLVELAQFDFKTN